MNQVITPMTGCHSFVAYDDLGRVVFSGNGFILDPEKYRFETILVFEDVWENGIPTGRKELRKIYQRK